ncbi:MAG: EpsI family protein [Rhizobacter sp.]
MNTVATRWTNWALLCLILLAAGLGHLLRPSNWLGEQRATFEMDQQIPRQFGDWRELRQTNNLIINPQLATQLKEIYTATLSRTYVNSAGATVMLSIAYGTNQSRDLQVHRPEVCYSSQGFQIMSSEKTQLKLPNQSIPSMRLVAKMGSRNEPITYWVRIGERLVRGNVEQGLARVSYGLQGYIPDGLLFRVSSISENSHAAFDVQKKFVEDLMASLPVDSKNYLLGSDAL